MDYVTLGTSDLKVSTLCLGSMSWGSKNTEAEGHAQIDRSLDAGINFIDTAEMYPTYPVLKDTTGRTEEIIGTWVAASGRRDDVVIATKVAGKNGGFLRDGAGYDGQVMIDAVETSLTRLQTDVIDLYQLHWPMRPHYHFRNHWTWDPSGQNKAEIEAAMLGVLQAMDQLVKAGKVRAFGLSNETTWGTAAWLRLAEAHSLPRMVSIQNEYSLMCRHADTDLAELCAFEDVGLLPFTPLVAGMMSASHGPDKIPPGTRRSRDESVGGRVNDRMWAAAAAYRDIAERHGLDVNQMALAWTVSRPFVASSIFGASSMDQLETALGAADLVLSDEVLHEIDIVHRAHPMPF
ncbi:MAG: aldo/keto reductase [Pseudomonadota bacterium]